MCVHDVNCVIYYNGIAILIKTIKVVIFTVLKTRLN